MSKPNADIFNNQVYPPGGEYIIGLCVCDDVAEVMRLKDAQLKYNESKANGIPQEDNLMRDLGAFVGSNGQVRILARHQLLIVDHIACAGDAQHMHQPAAVGGQRRHKQAARHLNARLDYDVGHIESQQPFPATDDCVDGTQIEIRALPQENKRANQVAKSQ